MYTIRLSALHVVCGGTSKPSPSSACVALATQMPMARVWCDGHGHAFTLTVQLVGQDE